MEKKRMGRPPKAPEERAGPAVQFRIRPELKIEIERHAAVTGRSISEECEFRLNRSIQRENSVAEIFGNPEQQPLMIALCNAVRWAGALSDGPDNVLQGYAAAIAVIEELADLKAREVLDRASETGHGWRDAAAAAVSLEKWERKPLNEMLRR